MTCLCRRFDPFSRFRGLQTLRTLETRTVARPLVKYVVCLSHLFGLMKHHVCRSVYFAIGPVDLESSNHFQIMAVIIESFREICHADIVWLLRGQAGFDRSSLVLHVPVLHLLAVIVGGNRAILESSKGR